MLQKRIELPKLDSMYDMEERITHCISVNNRYYLEDLIANEDTITVVLNKPEPEKDSAKPTKQQLNEIERLVSELPKLVTVDVDVNKIKSQLDAHVWIDKLNKLIRENMPF